MALATAKKVRVPHLLAAKRAGERITMLTAYDAPTARLVDAAGTDVILVGDSVGNVVLGYDDTLPVTVDDIVHHTRAAARGRSRALLVADMPYLSYHVTVEEAVRNAGRCLKEGGAEAVKVEGGRRRATVIEAMVAAEIPVMGHLGLTPQSVHAMGGYRVQGKTEEAADRLLEDALALERAGVFALVLEGMAEATARRVTEAVQVPTIGIGAGRFCDGQVLVFHDLLGFGGGPVPRFVRRYLDFQGLALEAIGRYAADVRRGRFPAPEETYQPVVEPDEALRA